MGFPRHDLKTKAWNTMPYKDTSFMGLSPRVLIQLKAGVFRDGIYKDIQLFMVWIMLCVNNLT